LFPTTRIGASSFLTGLKLEHMERAPLMLQHIELILAVLLGVSESLALIPQVKANGIVQLVLEILKKLVAKKD
jgi:hypothetical protein